MNFISCLCRPLLVLFLVAIFSNIVYYVAKVFKKFKIKRKERKKKTRIQAISRSLDQNQLKRRKRTTINQAQPQCPLQSRPQPQSQPQTQPQSQPQSQPHSQPQSQPQLQPQSQLQAQPQVQPQVHLNNLAFNPEIVTSRAYLFIQVSILVTTVVGSLYYSTTLD